MRLPFFLFFSIKEKSNYLEKMKNINRIERGRISIVHVYFWWESHQFFFSFFDYFFLIKQSERRRPKSCKSGVW